MSKNHEWEKRNRARCAAYLREWRAKNKEHCKKYYKEYRAKNKDRMREYENRYRRSPKYKAYLKAHKEQVRKRNRKGEIKRKIRKMIDAEYYAKRLAQQRFYKAKKTILSGKMYRPVMSRRTPSYCTMGNVTDYGSKFLCENITAEQKAYAKELYLERCGESATQL